MRKNDTLQLFIIIVAIVMGFSAIESLITPAISFVFTLMSEEMGTRYVATVAPYLLAGILQAVIA